MHVSSESLPFAVLECLVKEVRRIVLTTRVYSSIVEFFLFPFSDFWNFGIWNLSRGDGNAIGSDRREKTQSDF